MSFHEVKFPTASGKRASYGTVIGPRHMTSVIEMPGGSEQRISRYSNPRMQYRVEYTIKDLSVLTELMAFVRARRGATYGFRFWDPLDYTTNANHRGATTHTDQEIGIGDGTTTTFKLKKKYVDDVVERVRMIRKPIASTVKVGIDGVNQGAGWSVNEATGDLTFTVAPAEDEVITWGGEFDVPVRFSKEVDSWLQLSIESYNNGSAQALEMIELIDEGEVIGEMFGGGSKNFDMSADYTLSPQDGFIIVVGPQVAGLKLRLPDAASLGYTGDRMFWIINRGPEDVEVTKYGGTSFPSPAVVTAGNTVEAVLADEWYVA